MLGRETAIQKVIWENDWPYLYSEKDERVTTVPQEKVFEPTFEKRIDESSKKNEEISVGDNKRIFEKDDFDNLVLNPDYQSLRIPMDERYLSLSERPGYLRLFGRSGLSSQFSQSLIARRMTSYNMEIKTCVEYEPKVFKQMAGLIFMYDTENYLYLHITHDEDIGKCITLLKYENKKAGYLSDYIPIPEKEPVRLKLTINGTEAIFEYSVGDPDKSSCITNRIAPPVDASFLSDEACNQGWFTGAMIGICTQDLTGFGLNADFDYFEVKDLSM